MKLNTDRVDMYLAKKQLRRKDLSALSGLSKSNLSTILRRGTCTTLTAGRIASGLGVAVEEIVVPEEGGGGRNARGTGAGSDRVDSSPGS